VDSPTFRIAVLSRGFQIEILAHFEPLLERFAGWWIQLFAESEGKQRKGLFPTACSYTEDLHALGQYIQEGQNIVFETCIWVESSPGSVMVPKNAGTRRDSDIVDGKDFAYLNQIAYEATVEAHATGGVPVMVLNVAALTPYYLGQLFYFFEYACYISARLLGVDSFDQPGVEAYKRNILARLTRSSPGTG